MKIAPPQLDLPVTPDRNSTVGVSPNPWHGGAPSFEGWLDIAREKTERQPSRTFEFQELGMFGADRDTPAGLAEIIPAMEPAVAAAGLSPQRADSAASAATSSAQSREIRPQAPQQPPPVPMEPVNPVAASSWASATWTSATTAAGGRTDSLTSIQRPPPVRSVSGAVMTQRPRPGTPAETQGPTPTPASKPPQPHAQRQGPVQITLRQTEAGLVVQAFAQGGVSDEAAAWLRRRADELAIEHGLTVADLTINGTPIAAAANRRTS